MKQNLLLGISAMSGLAALTGCGPQAQKEQTVDLKRPNVIFIYSDDLGIGDLSCYGATRFLPPTSTAWRTRGFCLRMRMPLQLQVLLRDTEC